MVLMSHLLMGYIAFLLHRLHRVRVNSEYSDFMPVISGIPQGRVLDSSRLDSCSGLLHYKPHQTCRPTSFSRSCTENDVLWSLLTVCAVSGNYNFWTRGLVKVECHFPFRERKFYVVFTPGSESTWERKFQLLNVTSVIVPFSHSHGTQRYHVMCSLLEHS